MLFKHVSTKHVNRRRLSCTRHSADAHPYGVTAVRQALFYHFLRLGLMVRIYAFHECDGLTENGHVAFHYSLHHVSHRQLSAAKPHSVEVWVYRGLLCHTAVHGQSLIFFAVFRMYHNMVVFFVYSISLSPPTPPSTQSLGCWDRWLSLEYEVLYEHLRTVPFPPSPLV